MIILSETHHICVHSALYRIYTAWTNISNIRWTFDTKFNVKKKLTESCQYEIWHWNYKILSFGCYIRTFPTSYITLQSYVFFTAWEYISPTALIPFHVHYEKRMGKNCSHPVTDNSLRSSAVINMNTKKKI